MRTNAHKWTQLSICILRRKNAKIRFYTFVRKDMKCARESMCAQTHKKKYGAQTGVSCAEGKKILRIELFL